MPLDGISSKFLAKELIYELKDAKIDKVYQPNRFTILLHFRTNRVMKKLLISANPASPRIFLTSREFSNPQMPPSFCMMLRKHLVGATLIDIEQPDYERVFLFRFATKNELGDSVIKTLVAEIMGRYSNIIFLNEENKIHDALIHVDQEISSKREIMPARVYDLPPAQNKLTLEQILSNENEILPCLNEHENALNLERCLLNYVLGFSPLIARSIVDDSGLDSRLHVDQLSIEQKKILSKSFYKIAEMFFIGADCPTLYFKGENDTEPFDFHAFLLPRQPFYKKIDSFSMAMDVFYLLQDEVKVFSQRKADLERLINQTVQHVQKKLDYHQKDYEEGQKAEYFKNMGELLNSQLYLVKDGAEEVVLIDYFDPEQKELKIPLKSHLTPADNAAVFFKKYRKAQSKLVSSTKLLEEDKAEIQWLYSLRTALDKAENISDLKAIQQEIKSVEKPEKEKRSNDAQNEKHILKSALNPGKPGKKSKKYLQKKQQNKKKKEKVKKEESLPFREFLLDKGIIALAGRNNLQNDELSMRIADDDDLWFHAKDIAGTHVILKAEDGIEIENEHIEKAAQIAAWYSESNKIKSGFGGNIAVDSCLAKYVKKPKGAKPGMVIYTHFKTYFVKPLLPEKIENDY